MFFAAAAVYYLLVLGMACFLGRIWIRGLEDWKITVKWVRPAGYGAGLLLMAPALWMMGPYMGHALLFFMGAAAGWLVFLFLRRWRKWRPAACILAGAGLVLFGVVNAGRLADTEYTLITDKPLPGGKLEICLVSDLHLRGERGLERTEEICRRMEEAQPDMVVLAGDMFDEQTAREEIERAAQMFGGLSAPVYYVFGNHDSGLYGMADWDGAAVEKCLTAAGIAVLSGECMEMEGIWIWGREDMSMPAADTVIPETGYGIVIDHQPSRFDESVAAGADLQLSGHTHGGQIVPIGQIGVMAGLYDICYGLLERDGCRLIVSSGCGNWGFDLRTAKPCEVVYIHIQSEYTEE